jgi:hypothetical protein
LGDHSSLPVMIPWIFVPCGVCWRSALIAEYATNAASNALMARSGVAPACEGTPWNVAETPEMQFEVMMPAPCFPPRPSPGWSMRQAAISLYAPRSSKTAFPPPPSSAGVPSKMIRPGSLNCSRVRAVAMALAQPAIAIRLCPHAWPMPFKASISLLKPIVGASSSFAAEDMKTADHAVGKSYA